MNTTANHIKHLLGLALVTLCGLHAIACDGQDDGVAANDTIEESVQAEEVSASPSDTAVEEEVDTFLTSGWWKQGPSQEDWPPEAYEAMEKPQSDGNSSGIVNDPFCRVMVGYPTCQLTLGLVRDVTFIEDGYVYLLDNPEPFDDNYLTFDVHTATFKPLMQLTSYPYIESSPGVTFIGAPITDTNTIMSITTGFPDCYTIDHPPVYLETWYNYYRSLTSWQKLPDDSRAIIGYIGQSKNLIMPDAEMVSSVFLVSEDDMVDMSMFKGTKVTKENGFAFTIPTDMLPLEDAMKLLPLMVATGGVQCGQSEVDAISEAEKAGIFDPNGKLPDCYSWF